MQELGNRFSRYGLDMHGILDAQKVFWNLTPAALYEESARRGEGWIAEHGPLVVHTGKHTGRSPNDKFVVREPSTEQDVWWGKVNKAIDPAQYDGLYTRMVEHIKGIDLFVQDVFVGADPQHCLPIRIINEFAWANLFSQNMFRRPKPEERSADFKPEFTVVCIPHFLANPAVDGTRSEVFIIVNFAKRQILIGGTHYGGEIKKSIFTIMNYLMPRAGVLSMHCSANVGKAGDVALFFGLSGTGKTSLSADPARDLIGDDEHGWSDDGVFNFEGGCYAKVIRLSPTAEPQIYQTTRTFGTVLENVPIDPLTRAIDLDSEALTENTRSSYPLSQISNIVESGKAGHPSNVLFLAADAFGVLPPISRLTPAQAMYHFLSGYTAKVAGTEKGVTEPEATFSTCFGAPFLVWHPTVYANLLGKKIEKHQARVWLVNTGWSGGPYGIGSRMKIAYTRAMIYAALNGELDKVPYEKDPVFGVLVPTTCPNVPVEVLKPRNTWADKAAYDAQAHKLAQMFIKNFEQYADQAAAEVRAAGPIA